MVTDVNESSGILWRKRLYLACVGLFILPCLFGVYHNILNKEKSIDIAFAFLSAVFMASQFLMLKTIAKVFSVLFLFCFVIVELLPEWDKSPEVTVNQIRLIGFIFLVPPTITAICWKALR